MWQGGEYKKTEITEVKKISFLFQLYKHIHVSMRTAGMYEQEK